MRRVSGDAQQLLHRLSAPVLAPEGLGGRPRVVGQRHALAPDGRDRPDQIDLPGDERVEVIARLDQRAGRPA